MDGILAILRDHLVIGAAAGKRPPRSPEAVIILLLHLPRGGRGARRTRLACLSSFPTLHPIAGRLLIRIVVVEVDFHAAGATIDDDSRSVRWRSILVSVICVAPVGRIRIDVGADLRVFRAAVAPFRRPISPPCIITICILFSIIRRRTLILGQGPRP